MVKAYVDEEETISCLHEYSSFKAFHEFGLLYTIVYIALKTSNILHLTIYFVVYGHELRVVFVLFGTCTKVYQ